MFSGALESCCLTFYKKPVGRRVCIYFNYNKILDGAYDSMIGERHVLYWFSLITDFIVLNLLFCMCTVFYIYVIIMFY